MRLRDPHMLPKLTFAVSLVLAPLVYLLSTLVAPPLESNEASQLAQMAAHPDRTYLFALLTVIGSMLLLPAVLGITRLVGEDVPWPGYIGAGLTGLGVLIAIGDSFGLLWNWQMSAPETDRTQMAALLHRFDNTSGIALVFTIGGLALVAGCVLLGIALWRSDAVPHFAAVALPAGTIANIAGFSSNSRLLLDISALILLAAFLPVAIKLLNLTPHPHTRSASRGTIEAPQP